MGNGPTQNEPARLKPDNLVDPHACIGVQHLVNRHAESARIGKQRGDIAEHDAFVREIDDGADIVANRGFLAHGILWI